MEKVRVAVLSKWHVHAEQYANEFNKHPNSEVVCVWDSDTNRGKEWANSLNCPFEADLAAVLSNQNIDAVCVNTETTNHEKIITAAAKAGKHIFTEKVLATTLKECESIKEAVELSGVKFCISFPWRTKKEVLCAKALVESGAIGNITLIRVRNAHDGAVSNWLPEHFYDEKACGGGAMMDLGAHPMYLVSWFMGKPKRITSIFSNFTNRQVEDNAVSVIEFENNGIGVSETGFVSKNSPINIEISGDKGSIFVFGPDGNSVKISDSNGFKTIPESEMPQPLKPPTTMFIEGILYNKNIEFGIKDSIALTELMQYAYESHKTGKTITIR